MCKSKSFSVVKYSLRVWAGFLLLLSCGQKEAPKPAAAPSPVPGKITAEVRVSAAELRPGENYTITYLLNNGADHPVNVSRVVTNRATILPGSPGWRQKEVAAGQTVKVAEVTGKAEIEGAENLTATFSTDYGACDAPSVRLTVSRPQVAAPIGRIAAQITVTPNPARVGQAVTVSYELVDSTAEDVLVTSIQTDSMYPLQVGNPAWLTGLVAGNSTRVVARRVIHPREPGDYRLTAQFTTNKGSFTAPVVTLIVAAPQPEPDTGHVLAQIAISPNPCPLGSDYRIEYQVTNTTRQDVTVNSISTDLGVIDATSPNWLTGRAAAGRTTTIARIAGEGNAATSRRKTATFAIQSGDVIAPAVILIVE